jgi:hypothetical protein
VSGNAGAVSNYADTVESEGSFIPPAPGNSDNPRAKRIRNYLLSLPERVIRSATALSAGMVRELGEITLPASFRRTRLYQTLVESTLRFLIEQVGQVEGAYPPEGKLTEDFLLRRSAGNGIEMLGILAFRASPVWVMAALADLSGAGRHMVKEIAAALQAEGLLDAEASFETVDQMLDGFERTAGRLAEAINTPPLDVSGLRREWDELKREAACIKTPPIEATRSAWEDLKREAAAQNRTVFQMSSLIAISTISRLPENARWLSRCAALAARHGGRIFAAELIDHYRATLAEIRETGYFAYWRREFRPYLRAALSQFSPSSASTTERLIR